MLFENSIVCLVVFVCCFLAAHFWGDSRLPEFGGWLFFWMPVLVAFVSDRIFLIRILLGFGLEFLFGEFDPGSGRTLAACLTHASRTESAQLAG